MKVPRFAADLVQAMRLLVAGVDFVTTALWLGHERAETTMVDIHADITIQEHALARTADPASRRSLRVTLFFRCVIGRLAARMRGEVRRGRRG
jgi:hypothetical protein